VGGSYAAYLNAPILLVETDSIEPTILSYIEMNIDEVVVLGGPNAISDEVLSEILAAIK
jgi:putative cell wall-binding protein